MKKIKLTGKRGGYALVDNDKAWLSCYKWYHSNKGYAVRGGSRSGKTFIVALHHAVIGYPLKGEVDHINRNPLDNRQCNLRICSRGLNSANRVNPSKWGRNIYSSQYKNKPYKVICFCSKNQKLVFGGYFVTIKEAETASKALRRKLGYAAV